MNQTTISILKKKKQSSCDIWFVVFPNNVQVASNLSFGVFKCASEPDFSQ